MIYEYKCYSCGEIVEKNHGMHDKPIFLCEKCNAELKRYYANQIPQLSKLETFNKEYHDISDGNTYPYSKMESICKSRNQLFLSNEEIKQEAQKNKARIKKEDDFKFKKNLSNDLQKAFKK